jgi:hypothetical protein
LIDFALGMLLAMSVLSDLHGYYVKSSLQSERQAEVIALGNWIIYLARMMNVIFAMALAFVYELQMPIRLSVIFFVGFLIALMGSLIYLRSPSLERGLTALLGFLFYRPFASLRGIKYWRKVGFGVRVRWLSMMVSAAFVYIALFLPFVAARFYPEFRMTVVFIGQLMNFMSTAILLAYIEPRIMQGLDAKTPQDQMDGFISGRVMLVGLMAVLSLAWVLAFRN